MPDNQRAIGHTSAADNTAAIPVGINKILAIGVNNYVHLPKLHNATRDINDITAALIERYDFIKDNIIFLLDEQATRSNIINTLYRLTNASQLGPNDSLIIYFSGHGYLDDNGDGYWIPVDAEVDDHASYIPNFDIRNQIKNMKCRHVLLVSDSCFSGSLLYRDSGIATIRRDIYELQSKPSRWMFTSGGSEPVADGNAGGNSPFANAIILELKTNVEQNLIFDKLAIDVRENTSSNASQLPQFGSLRDAGDMGGRFIFTLKPEFVKGSATAVNYPVYTTVSSTSASFTDSPESSETKKILNPGILAPFIATYGTTLRNVLSIIGAAAVAGTVYFSQCRHSDVKNRNENDGKRNEQIVVVPALPTNTTPILTKPKEELPEIISEPPMVFVQGGQFSMGQSNPNIGCSGCSVSEQPVHDVNLEDFSIGKYEVTQRLWMSVMGNNPSHHEKCNFCPVENISRFEARSFILKLNEKTGKNYRLPTEAEWEYAARGGIKTQNRKYSGANELDRVGWFFENADKNTHVVGQKQPNELGIYDMSGNVYEWCGDVFLNNFYKSSEYKNPSGPRFRAPNDVLVIRGGSVNNLDIFCRSAARSSFNPMEKREDIGLRLVLSDRRDEYRDERK